MKVIVKGYVAHMKGMVNINYIQEMQPAGIGVYML